MVFDGLWSLNHGINVWVSFKTMMQIQVQQLCFRVGAKIRCSS